jgi:KipI family sensor histidine kinase inhibitor
VTAALGDAVPTMLPLGDAAITIRVGDRVDAATAARVRALAQHIRAAALDHVREIVLGYATLAVWYDALHADCRTMVSTLESIVHAVPPTAEPATGAEPRLHEIAVWYDGPDLADVARRTGLSIAQVVARHSGRWYDVYFLGFVPGFAYLGELDPVLIVPRRAEPRTRVPAGAVAIAGAQTAVYPLATPGGWHLIGHTDVTLFDPAADPPARLAPGDRVRFVARAE